MPKPRVTARKEGSHWVINVAGRGMTLAMTPHERDVRLRQYRRSVRSQWKRGIIDSKGYVRR